MKKPHFFKAFSRIGLTNPPIRRTELNTGVEDAPNAILTPRFLATLPESTITEYSFTKPELIDSKDYQMILTKELIAFKNIINHELKSDEMQIVLGGDNTVTFSAFLALLERVGDPKRIGYIQFDSHGEINSYHGSESKNFHGMYMRPFFDQFDIPEINQLIPEKLDPNQMFIFGDQVLDGDEPEFYAKHNLQSITFSMYQQNKEIIHKKFVDFLNRFDFIHVNFDIDIFHRSVAGATGIPEDGQWLKQEIFEILQLLTNHQNLSFDLSEVNPTKHGHEQTIALSQQIVSQVIDG